MKLLFYGIKDPNGLCKSYMRSAEKLDLDIGFFDYEKSILENINYGKLGLFVHQHFSPENWVQKINRHFVVTALADQPDLILTFTNAPITPSAILFLKSVLPKTKFILVWPDSLLNIKNQTLSSTGLYDWIATYGSTSVPLLEDYSKTKVSFIPLAGDPDIHGMIPSEKTLRDIGFVGGWRPERQRTMEQIVQHFPKLSIEIHGPLWKKKCKGSSLAKFIKGQGLRGMEMARFFNTTRMNINTIDDTNYPSANMRFFEIPTAGGLELVSSCPEMENIFHDREDLLYFHDEPSLTQQIQWILDHPEKESEIKKSAHHKILDQHTYTHRLQSILELVK
jgi:hypothetical protein